MIKIDKSKQVKKETPSINLSSIHKEEEVEEEEVEEINDRETFDQEMLNQALKDYVSKRKAEEASEMELLILQKPFTLLEGNQLQLVLSNSLELNILERLEQDVTQYLRKTLKNGLIKIQPQVAEVEEKDKLYTDRDKFQFMVQKNPELQKLKDRLGLDFEF